jgi:thioredoxin-like negative regulator of GroEL
MKINSGSIQQLKTMAKDAGFSGELNDLITQMLSQAESGQEIPEDQYSDILDMIDMEAEQAELGGEQAKQNAMNLKAAAAKLEVIAQTAQSDLTSIKEDFDNDLSSIEKKLDNAKTANSSSSA